MLKLYKFHWDGGRGGDIEGLFAAKEEDVDQIYGKDVYFGEVLGKHSQVYGTIEKDEIWEISDDQKVIQHLIEAVGSNNICGYNPFDYYEEDEEDE